jgi:hypothetical protein
MRNYSKDTVALNPRLFMSLLNIPEPYNYSRIQSDWQRLEALNSVARIQVTQPIRSDMEVVEDNGEEVGMGVEGVWGFTGKKRRQREGDDEDDVDEEEEDVFEEDERDREGKRRFMSLPSIRQFKKTVL